MPEIAPYLRLMVDIIDSGLWASLSPGARTLYPVLLKFSDFHFKPVWPSTETLLKLTGFKTKKSIVLAKKELCKAGLLFQIPGGGRTSTKYHFSFHYEGSKITPLGEKHLPRRGSEGSSGGVDSRSSQGDSAGNPNHIQITISNNHQWNGEKVEAKTKEGEETQSLSDLISLFGSDLVFQAYQEAESLHLQNDIAFLRGACQRIHLKKTNQKKDQISAPISWEGSPISWRTFLAWAQGKLSETTWKELSGAEIGIDGSLLVVSSPLSQYSRQLVLSYFQSKGDFEVVFSEPKLEARNHSEIR